MVVDVPTAPRSDAWRLDQLQALWAGAGLDAVETREITVQRTYADFDDYWTTILAGPSVRERIGTLSSADTARFRDRLRQRLPAADAAGRITTSARANAIKGRVR